MEIILQIIVIVITVIIFLGLYATEGLLSRLTYLLFLIGGFVIGIFTLCVFATLCAQLTNPPALMVDWGAMNLYPGHPVVYD